MCIWPSNRVIEEKTAQVFLAAYRGLAYVVAISLIFSLGYFRLFPLHNWILISMVGVYTLFRVFRPFHWYKRNYEGFMNALEFYQQALEKDQNYALAYTGIADTYSTLAGYSYMSSEEAFPKAKEAVKKALEIDDTLAEAHISLAKVALSYDWDWTRAEKEFKRAIELNPGYALAHHWYSDYLRAMGRLDESLAEMKLALEIDPLSPIQYAMLSHIYRLLGDYDRALEQCHKGLEIDPNFEQIHLWICIINLDQGNYMEDIEALQKAKELSKGSIWIESYIGMAYAFSGERDKAEQILNQLLERKKNEYISPISISLIYFGLGDNNKGFEWLEKAYDDRVAWLPFTISYFKFSPLWKFIRSDPRFKAMLKKMNLPE